MDDEYLKKKKKEIPQKYSSILDKFPFSSVLGKVTATTVCKLAWFSSGIVLTKEYIFL